MYVNLRLLPLLLVSQWFLLSTYSGIKAQTNSDDILACLQCCDFAELELVGFRQQTCRDSCVTPDVTCTDFQNLVLQQSCELGVAFSSLTDLEPVKLNFSGRDLCCRFEAVEVILLTDADVESDEQCSAKPEVEVEAETEPQVEQEAALLDSVIDFITDNLLAFSSSAGFILLLSLFFVIAFIRRRRRRRRAKKSSRTLSTMHVSSSQAPSQDAQTVRFQSALEKGLDFQMKQKAKPKKENILNKGVDLESLTNRTAKKNPFVMRSDSSSTIETHYLDYVASNKQRQSIFRPSPKYIVKKSKQKDERQFPSKKMKVEITIHDL